MRNTKLWFVSVPVFLAVGCGGAGNSQVATDFEQETDLGMVTTRAAGAVPPPVVASTKGLVVTGLAGASFSLARINYPAMNSLNAKEILDRTQIAYSYYGRPQIYNWRDGSQFRLTQDRIAVGDMCYPAFSPLGDRVISSERSAPGASTRLVSRVTDGTSNTVVIGESLNPVQPTYSADGARVAYVRKDANGWYQIYSATTAGASILQLTTGNAHSVLPQYSPDGTKICFLTSDANGFYAPFVMNVNGTGRASAFLSPASVETHYIDWMPDGSGYVAVQLDRSNVTYSIGRAIPGQQISPIYTSSQSIFGVSPSPDGSLLAFNEGNLFESMNLFTIDAFGNGKTQRTTQGGCLYPQWGPYVRTRTMIGNGGATGLGAGFLFSQKGKDVPGFVVFDATTRSGVTLAMEPSAPETPNLVAIVNAADSLTMLRYANGMFGTAVSVVTSSAPVNGAIVSFDVETGEVATIVPFVGATPTRKAGTRSLEYAGRFTGVWNGEGRNLAEGGAQFLILDPRTGRLESSR